MKIHDMIGKVRGSGEYILGSQGKGLHLQAMKRFWPVIYVVSGGHSDLAH